MSAEKQIRILHAGLHKTGSTFLQQHVFPKMTGITYLHGYSFGRMPKISREHNTPILFSSEAACGYPYPETPEFCVDTLLANVRLLSISKVILFTREFNKWLLSLYFQTLNETSSWSLEEFIERNASALLTWKNASEEIATALSEEGVEFFHLQQESLMETPDKVIGEICSFVGAPKLEAPRQVSNRSRTGAVTVKTYRVLNKTYRFRLLKAIYRMGIINPRKLIQHGKLGAFTEKLSKKQLTAEHIGRLLS